MKTKKLDRRDFIRLSSGALGYGLLATGNCAYHATSNDDKNKEDPIIVVPEPTKKILVCSDIHIGYEEDGVLGETYFSKALGDIKTNVGNIDYSCILGDLTQDGTQDQFDIYKAIRASTTIPNWYEITGNHDLWSGIDNYKEYLSPNLTYMVTDGNLLWFFLSDEVASNEGDISEQTYLWLKKKLSMNQDKNIIICSHHLVYGTIRHSTEFVRYISPKDWIEDLLSSFRIDAWFCGHWHYAPHSQGDYNNFQHTTFLNISSMHHAYQTNDSESYILHLTEGANYISANRRSHDFARYLKEYSVDIPLPYELKLGSPIMEVVS